MVQTKPRPDSSGLLFREGEQSSMAKQKTGEADSAESKTVKRTRLVAPIANQGSRPYSKEEQLNNTNPKGKKR